MGIIKAVFSAVGGGLSDSFLEVFEPDAMDASTLAAPGVLVRKNDKRNQNKKGTDNFTSDGSKIQVGENQCMLLIDGGKVVDFSAEPGYYEVKNDNAPSLFNGSLGEAITETFSRIKFGGVPSSSQRAVYINTQEIKNIAFGTQNAINYFDNFYNAELYLRAHGYFSIRITDPLKFYSEVVPKTANRIEISDMQKQYLSEFLTALQTAIGKMSVDNIRISHLQSKTAELADYLSDALDSSWTSRRGIIVESVGISSLSYDEESKKLINIRNQGAMLQEPGIREGYVQGSVARGIEAAGSNSAGAVSGFMGMGLGMQQGGGVIGAASAANSAGAQREAQTKDAGTGASWKCQCGASSNGNFCASCGGKRPQAASKFCSNCGAAAEGNFCAGCGAKI